MDLVFLRNWKIIWISQFSLSVESDSLRPHESPGLPVRHQLLEFTQTHVHLVSDAIQPSHPLSPPFSSCPQSDSATVSFPKSQLFASGGQSIGVSASASALVFPMNPQDWSPLGWTGWSSCRPRDSQESSPTPQFKSINSSVLSFFYSPTLTWPLAKP